MMCNTSLKEINPSNQELNNCFILDVVKLDKKETHLCNPHSEFCSHGGITRTAGLYNDRVDRKERNK